MSPALLIVPMSKYSDVSWSVSIAILTRVRLTIRYANPPAPYDNLRYRNHVGRVGTALFDLDSEREAWEVVLDKTHFVMKPNKKLAPELHSRLCIDVIIDKRKHELQCSKKDLEAVLLHNMVNCNRVLSRGPNAKLQPQSCSNTYLFVGSKRGRI